MHFTQFVYNVAAMRLSQKKFQCINGVKNLFILSAKTLLKQKRKRTVESKKKIKPCKESVMVI